MTGTFDDWGKTVKLERVGDIFLKKVTISPVKKVHYKVREKKKNEKRSKVPDCTRVDGWR